MKTTVSCKISWSEKDKCWYVESPGFYDGVITDGDTLEDAKNAAAEAVAGLIESYLEHETAFKIPDVKNATDWYSIPIRPELAFSFWLRSQRKARGMTLSDVAEKMGVKYQVYQKLENPKTANPTLKTLYKIEQIFNAELIAI
ncbi:MAG: helix-turn-helix transcriptional regulator [Acidobacteriota bacterium]|jgi:antitoxin HicB|nr:helix-turn-helix transcriptional regulator [Acidobacteriota bacterium]